MIPPASRVALRSSAPRALRSVAARRFASSKPPADRPRSWKGFAARWGLAIGGIYYYNTSPYFQQEVHAACESLLQCRRSTHAPTTHPLTLVADTPENFPITTTEDENTSLPTLEELAASRRARLAILSPSDSPASSSTTLASAAATTPSTTSSEQPPSDPSALEDEASQQGAFNEETGEINWDCPCLGGMAHGPCGPEFREAFSCFVYSKEEPKGMDCIDKFKGMQGCFREHPEVYGAELAEDEEEAALDGEGAPAGGAIAGPGGDVAPAPYSGAGGDLEGKLPDQSRTAVPSSSPGSLGGETSAEKVGPTGVQGEGEGKGVLERARDAKEQVKEAVKEELPEGVLMPRESVVQRSSKTDK